MNGAARWIPPGRGIPAAWGGGIGFVWGRANLGRDCKVGDLRWFHLLSCCDSRMEVVGTPWRSAQRERERVCFLEREREF